MVFCAICTCCAIGSKSFSSANLMPTAARLALPVNVFVATMVDSFMMMLLLSLRFHFSIGMPHHPAFGKLLSGGSLPLIGAKFRYLTMRRLRAGCEYGYDTIMNSQIQLNYGIFNFIVEIILRSMSYF